MENLVKKKAGNKISLLLGIFILVGFLILILSFSQAIEEVLSGEGIGESLLNASQDTLSPGKNIVIFDDYMNVRNLVLNNPGIETISYIDEFNQESVGYINAFGGIGKDFIIVPGIQYEIFVKNYLKLSL